MPQLNLRLEVTLSIVPLREISPLSGADAVLPTISKVVAEFFLWNIIITNILLVSHIRENDSNWVWGVEFYPKPQNFHDVFENACR